MIYLDNASSTSMDPLLVAKLSEIYSLTGNPSAMHTGGRTIRSRIDTVRQQIKRYCGMSTGKVVFTSGGTEANNIAIQSVLRNTKAQVAVSAIEHPSVLEQRLVLERGGISMVTIPITAQGIVDVDAFERLITPSTALVSVMHVNNIVGTVQPLDVIGKICREKKIALHVDATQGFHKLPIDMDALGISLLTVSAHKFHGPRGVGALIVNGAQIHPLHYGGGQEEGIRSGTENVSGILLMGQAIEIGAQTDRIVMVRNRFEQLLMTLPGVHIHGTDTLRAPHITCVSFDAIESTVLLEHLNSHEVYASAGSACHSGLLEPSHVMMAMGVSLSRAHSMIRFSYSRFTTMTEIESAFVIVKAIVMDLGEG